MPDTGVVDTFRVTSPYQPLAVPCTGTAYFCTSLYIHHAMPDTGTFKCTVSCTGTLSLNSTLFFSDST